MITEMEYRSMFASLLHDREDLNDARNWLCYWVPVLMMRIHENNLDGLVSMWARAIENWADDKTSKGI